MPKCNLRQKRTSAWVFSCKFAAYFQNGFYLEHLWVAVSGCSSYINQQKKYYFWEANSCNKLKPKRLQIISEILLSTFQKSVLWALINGY